MDYQEKYQFAVNTLKNFNNYIEIADFRKFLLLILNLDSGGPEAMLRKLGMAPKDKSTLPYDPEKKVYYTKIMSGLTLTHQLVIYHRCDKISDQFVNKDDSTFFTGYLTDYERKNLLPKDFLIISPDVVDQSTQVFTDQDSPIPCSVGVESMYSNLGEMIATQNLKFFFLIKGESADLVFTINMLIEPTLNSKKCIQYFDVFIDTEKSLRNYTYIRMKKEEVRKGILKMEFLKEIKELNHSEIYDSKFTIIVPIDSLKVI
jgi:hypothetical protein